MKFITTSMEDAFSLRLHSNSTAKGKIASEALRFIETGRSIFLDSGTTLLELASYIPEERLTITTTGPNIAIELLKYQSIIVNLVGGMVNRHNVSVSGALSNEYIDNVNIDIAFISPSGFSLKNGFTSGNWNECELKKLVVKKATKTIVLLDTNKIDKTMPYTFCGLENIHEIITNERLPREIEEEAKKCGVKITVAD